MFHKWNRQEITFTLLALIAAIAVLSSGTTLFGIIQPPSIGDSISSGEEILIKYTGLDPDTQTFQKLKDDKQFQAAIDLAKKKASLTPYTSKNSELCADPEPLIYLNNQQIPPQEEAYTIAVVAPIDSSSRKSALEILRGVAQAQNEFNNSQQKGNKRYLRVVIANENNDEKEKKSTINVAKTLLKQKEVLGVVGHFSTGATKAATEIYRNKLVAISPSSTSTEINENGQNIYFFRTIPNNNAQAQLLANYMWNNIKPIQTPKNAAIIFNKDNPYSESLKDEFKTKIESKGGQAFSYDLNNQVNPFAEAREKNFSVIMLAVNSSSISDALLPLPEINSEKQKFSYLGGNAMYKPSRLNSSYMGRLRDMVIAIPWHYDVDLPKSRQFVEQAYKLWCQPRENEENITWLTATAYDATNVFIEAIENTKIPTRDEIQKYIKAEFTQDKLLIGVTGNISFKDNGDLDRESRLVQIKEKKEGEKIKYVYKLLKSS